MLENWQDYLSVETLTKYAMEYGTALLGAVLIFLIGRKVAKLLASFAEKMMRRGNIDETIVAFLGNIVYGLLYAFVIIAALTELGVETTSLAAVIAAAGLAIGLALQGSLSNFAAGVMIIAFRPFKNGDYIEANGIAGTVEEVDIFTTTLKTPDNKTIIIPNSNITSNAIINYSSKPTRRVDMVFGIGYDDNIKEAKALIEAELKKETRILKDPAYVIAVGELADSSVNLLVRPWVKSSDYWDVQFSLTEKIKEEFDAAGISIPFPQQDVHMHQVEAKPAKAKKA